MAEKNKTALFINEYNKPKRLPHAGAIKGKANESRINIRPM